MNPSNTRLRPGAYAAAIYAVGFVVLLEFALFFSVFWFRDQVVRNIDVSAPTVSPLAKGREAAREDVRPTPAGLPTRLDPLTVANPKVRVQKLNQEALDYQQQGDLHLAEASWSEAEKLDPLNPITLTGLAGLAEKQGDNARARQYWQRVLDLGQTPSRALAETRLQKLGGTDILANSRRAELPRRLSIGEIERTDASSLTGSTEFTLRIPILSGANEREIDAGSVGIKLFCYDRTLDGRVVPTVGRITAKFEGDRQTWTKNHTEVLLAKYVLPADEATRKYHGYVLRVYYLGELQDETASPPELLMMVAPR
jgi:tetratricopeptide (TPR) repeat protein